MESMEHHLFVSNPKDILGGGESERVENIGKQTSACRSLIWTCLHRLTLGPYNSEFRSDWVRRVPTLVRSVFYLYFIRWSICRAPHRPGRHGFNELNPAKSAAVALHCGVGVYILKLGLHPDAWLIPDMLRYVASISVSLEGNSCEFTSYSSGIDRGKVLLWFHRPDQDAALFDLSWAADDRALEIAVRSPCTDLTSIVPRQNDPEPSAFLNEKLMDKGSHKKYMLHCHALKTLNPGCHLVSFV